MEPRPLTPEEREQADKYHRLQVVLKCAPGLTDRDREMIEWGYNLAQENGDEYVAKAWERKYHWMPTSLLPHQPFLG